MLTVGPGVFIIPEIGWVGMDRDDAAADSDLWLVRSSYLFKERRQINGSN
jgi:pyruvate/2-oxoglutarate dehydrogenase complex dihydrolipoamide dehydrogenase (E3) component